MRKEEERQKWRSEVWEGLNLPLLALKMEEEGHKPKDASDL